MSLSVDTIITISTVVFSIVAFWVRCSAKRPRPRIIGSSTGSISVPNRDVMASSIHIHNDPFFFGFRVRREPATITSARIYDLELKEYVGPVLMWAKDGSHELEREVIINSGKQRRLYLFAKDRYSEEYFILSVDKLNTDLPRLPDKYKDKKKEFRLVLFDEEGRTYKFNLTVRNRDQSVDAGPKFTKLGARSYHLREAVRHLRQTIWLR